MSAITPDNNRGDDRRDGFSVWYSSADIMRKIDGIERRLDRITGIGAFLAVVGSGAVGAVVSHLLG